VGSIAGFSIGSTVKLVSVGASIVFCMGAKTMGIYCGKTETFKIGFGGSGFKMVSFLISMAGFMTVMFIDSGGYSIGFAGVESFVVVSLVDWVSFTCFICVGSVRVGFTPGHPSLIYASVELELCFCI
jgi:hypothetical protein